MDGRVKEERGRVGMGGREGGQDGEGKRKDEEENGGEREKGRG